MCDLSPSSVTASRKVEGLLPFWGRFLSIISYIELFPYTNTHRPTTIYSISLGGHLRCKPGYEALRQLAQNDPILQRSF